MTDRDIVFMQAAMREAIAAFEAGEIPIGAVVVINNKIIGRGHNLTEQLHDVTAHAEIIAITAATQTLGAKYLKDCTLYVTVEPCLMCAGAIGWSQISRIVYAAPDPRRGYTSLTRTDRPIFHPSAHVESGIMAEDAIALMRQFFSSKR